MRTGAIFARGSCRASKWLTLVGLVAVLGSGAAFAQTVNVDTTKGGGDGIETTVRPPAGSRPEGADIYLDVTLHALVMPDVTADAETTLALGVTSGPATLITASPQTVTIPKHSGNSQNAEPRSVTTTFRLATATDTGGEDDTVVLSLTPASPFSTSAQTINVMLEDPQTQSYTLARPTADRAKVITAGSVVTLEFKSMLALETATSYTVTTSNPSLGAVTPLTIADSTAVADAKVDVDIMLTVANTVSNGDFTQIVVSIDGDTSTGRPARAVADFVARVGPATGPDPTTGLTFTPATQPDITVVAGAAMMPMQLPMASGGTAPYMYMATGLPAGLMVSSTGMLSGTPTMAASAMTVTYTATDSATPAATGSLMFDITVSAAAVTPKSTTAIMTAVEDAQMAADSDGDGRWTPEDDPAIVPLAALFNGLPEMFDAEAMSSTAHVQASILASSGLTRASNPAVALRPVSAGMAHVTVTAAGVSATLPSVTVASSTTAGTASARRLSSVSVGALREGGQAQATVRLNLPVEPRKIFKAKLRLVGQTHTREDGRVAALASPNPSRVVNGVRVHLTGELTEADYDADVIGELTIQPGESSGTVTITTGTDADAEPELLELQVIKDGQTFTPTSDALPAGGRSRVFTVEDVHEQSYVLTAVPSTIYESGNFATSSTLRFTPNHVREDEGAFVTLTSNHPEYSALFTFSNGGTGTSAGLPRGDGSVTAQFQLVPERRAGCVCDGDRMDDEVEITATVTANGVAEEVAKTTVTVVDVHKLPKLTVTAMTESGGGPLMELAEGAKYKVRVEANRNDPSGEVTGETVTVSLALGDDSTAVAEDYRITPSSRRITGGLNDQSATFDLEVLGADGDIGEETLVLDAMVTGGGTNGGGTETKGMLSVTLVDTTTLNVEPRSDTEVQLAVVKARNAAEGADDLWTYGDDDLSIELGDLFKLPADGFTTTADAVSADAKVVTAQADAGIVTVTAVGMGTTMVTVTATTAASGVQISPNIASVEFEIEVDELTRVFMVSGPDDMMNLVEGGEGAMVTVSTNIPVSENTEVMLMRDGSSSAGDDDYMLQPSLVTIMAGEMTGSTTVTATEDSMAEEMEMLTLFLVVDDMQMTDKSVSFYLWDAAVPALPVIAQLLLAAFLAIGGCRRYLRR